MFYSFTHSQDKRKIGKYPQSRTMSYNYQYYADNSVWNILNKKIDFEPNLDAVQLNYHAKLTDLIFCAPLGGEIRGNLLISEKLMEIFTQFISDEYQIFEAKVLYRKKMHKYYLLHFWNNQNYLIDFKQSKFYIGSRLGFKQEELTLNSFEHYRKFKKQLESHYEKERIKKVIGLSKLILDRNNIKQDFFRITNLTNLFVLSKKLLLKLIEENITGFDYKRVTDLNFKVHYDTLERDNKEHET